MQNNPYKPPVEPFKESGFEAFEAAMARFAWVPIGTLFGWIGGWFVWHSIDGIGSRVITDELFETLLADVSHGAAVFGALSGALIAVIFKDGCVRSLFVQHSVGIATGMVYAHWGWQNGLGGYFVGQVLAIVLLCTSLLPAEPNAE